MMKKKQNLIKVGLDDLNSLSLIINRYFSETEDNDRFIIEDGFEDIFEEEEDLLCGIIVWMLDKEERFLELWLACFSFYFNFCVNAILEKDLMADSQSDFKSLSLLTVKEDIVIENAFNLCENIWKYISDSELNDKEKSRTLIQNLKKDSALYYIFMTSGIDQFVFHKIKEMYKKALITKKVPVFVIICLFCILNKLVFFLCELEK